MASAVKSKIASFETQIQHVRSQSPSVRTPNGAGSGTEPKQSPRESPSPSRARYSPSGNGVFARDSSGSQWSSSSPVASSSLRYPLLNGSPSRNRETQQNPTKDSSTIVSNGKNGEKPSYSKSSSATNGHFGGLEELAFRGTTSGGGDLDETNSETGSLTSAASLSRKTRLRQQQFETASAVHHPVNLMEKRKQIKERRLRAAGAAAGGGDSDTPQRAAAAATKIDDVAVKYSSATATATTAVSSSGTASKNMSRRMIAARKAGNRRPNSPPRSGPKSPAKSKHNGDADGSSNSTSPRLNHFHGTPAVISQSRSDDATNDAHPGRSETYVQLSADDCSPDRKESRRSKFLRVQRLKGSSANQNPTDQVSLEIASDSTDLVDDNGKDFDGGVNNGSAPTTEVLTSNSKSGTPISHQQSPHVQQKQGPDSLQTLATHSQDSRNASRLNIRNPKTRGGKASIRNRESIASSIMTTATMSTAVAAGARGAGDDERRLTLQEEVRHAQTQRHQQSQDQFRSHDDGKTPASRESSPSPATRVNSQSAMMLSTPPESPYQVGGSADLHNRNAALEPAGITLSPQIDGSDPGFSPLMGNGMSPRSGTDVYSDTHDTSVLESTVMDDEATLTSVRRIMAPKSTPTHTGRRGSHDDIPYDQQQQQQQRHQPDAEGQFLGSEHQISLSSKRDSVFRNGASDEYHRLQGNGGGGLTPTSQYSRNEGRTRRGINRRNRDRGSWMEEEKSEKVGHYGVFQTASSSDYDTDGDVSKTSKDGPLMVGQSHSQATDVTEFYNSARGSRYNNRRQTDDDDRTFDYGDREDDESNGSASQVARRRREAERRARESDQLQQSQPPYRHGSGNQNNGPDTPRTAASESPLMSQDEVDKVIETPAFKVGCGVVGAATVGCMILGPVGLLVGAAAVGIGVGVMQIPEEHRNDMQDRAKQTIHKIHNKACDATEALSTSCLSHYKDSGVADHLPHCLSGSDAGGTVVDDHISTQSESARRQRNNDGTNSLPGGAANHHLNPSNLLSGPEAASGPTSATSQNSGRGWRNQKVACLREGAYDEEAHIVVVNMCLAGSEAISAMPDNFCSNLLFPSISFLFPLPVTHKPFLIKCESSLLVKYMD